MSVMSAAGSKGEVLAVHLADGLFTYRALLGQRLAEGCTRR